MTCPGAARTLPLVVRDNKSTDTAEWPEVTQETIGDLDKKIQTMKGELDVRCARLQHKQRVCYSMRFLFDV